MVNRTRVRSTRLGLSVALVGLTFPGYGLTACSNETKEDAQQVARATKKTVARGVDKAKEAIDRVDVDKVRNAWDSTVEAVAGSAETPAADAPDPLAGAAEAIACDAKFERCTVTAEFADRARHQGSAVAASVRVHPVKDPARGIRLDIIDKGSLATLLGLRVGDIITYVNGVSLGSLQDAMMLYMQIRAANSFTVNYRRGDEDRVLVVDVVYPEAPENAQ